VMSVISTATAQVLLRARSSARIKSIAQWSVGKGGRGRRTCVRVQMRTCMLIFLFMVCVENNTK
jgi:hypothetical protein